MINGIDVSSAQGTVPWQAVKNAGNEFAFCKCYTGNDGLDPTYATNFNGASAAGLCVGSYNFLYPLQTDSAHPNRDPQGQARLHFSNCKPGVVAADLEWPPPQDWSKWGVSANFIADWTLTYLQTYESLSGSKPILYTYPYFAQAVSLPIEFANYKLWLASYNSTVPAVAPWAGWTVLQNSDSGRLPTGVPVDTDQVLDLSLWGA